jgi:trans-aconitate 2-methyltransferase
VSDKGGFEKVYPHLLENADALAEWTSGTVMVPYFERLPDPLREAFLQRYRERLRERWPESPVFYPFRRILFAGKKR